MRCVLGIDAGGSKCDAILVREDGVALGWGHVSDPRASRYSSGHGRSKAAISYAGWRALRPLRDTPCDELHISCVTSILPLGFWRRLDIDRVLVEVVSEHTAAMALAGVANGLVALAGTGAFVYLRTSDGRRIQLDGLGPLLGDHGGGYQVGFLALRAVARADWATRYATSLCAPVYEALDISRPAPGGFSLVGILDREHDRSTIAALARVVDEQAIAGDRIAREILESCARDLAVTVEDTLAFLEVDPREPYALVGTGGLMRSEIYWQAFCARVAELAPGLTPIRSDLPAVVGIALPTLQKLNPDPAVRDTLLRTTRELLARQDTEPDVPYQEFSVPRPGHPLTT